MYPLATSDDSEEEGAILVRARAKNLALAPCNDSLPYLNADANSITNSTRRETKYCHAKTTSKSLNQPTPLKAGSQAPARP